MIKKETKRHVIYGAKSGIIRRIVVSDDPEPIESHVGPGEAFLEIPKSVFVPDNSGRRVPHLERLYAHLAKKTGVISESPRCLVIHHGTAEVVDVIMADPLLDKIEGHTLFQDATGSKGDVPDETGSFAPQVVAE